MRSQLKMILALCCLYANPAGAPYTATHLEYIPVVEHHCICRCLDSLPVIKEQGQDPFLVVQTKAWAFPPATAPPSRFIEGSVASSGPQTPSLFIFTTQYPSD